MTAAIYATRAGLNTLVLEQETCGGLANWAVEIENFPSHEKISGMELMEKVKSQTEKLGAEILEIVEVEGCRLEGALKSVDTDEGAFQARAIIIATGREPIPLPVEADTEHLHYCAICDGAAYRGKNVLVVGGGNSGVGDALYLLNQGVGRVILVEAADRLFASQTAQDALFARSNIEIYMSTEVSEVIRENDELTVRLTGNHDGRELTVSVSGLFVYIGQTPRTELFKGLIDLDGQGYITTDQEMRTNVAGVFAAGDVRCKKYRQLTTAMNDGAIAALAAEEYIRSVGDGAH